MKSDQSASVVTDILS